MFDNSRLVAGFTNGGSVMCDVLYRMNVSHIDQWDASSLAVEHAACLPEN
jgi:hypothetical protein